VSQGARPLAGRLYRIECELGQRLPGRAPGQQATPPTGYGRKIVAAIRAAERRAQ
jgi:hypothetical protein